MSIQDAIQEVINTSIDRIAARGDVEELCIAVAVALACGDVETVNYVGDNYAQMFSEQQQAAFADIKARTPQILADQQKQEAEMAQRIKQVLEDSRDPAIVAGQEQAVKQALANIFKDPVINEAMQSDNPLTAHLQELNKTVQ